MKLSTIAKFKKVGDVRELESWCYTSDGTPVRVETYLNESTRKVYQVDKKLPRYREADDGGFYGPWKDES